MSDTSDERHNANVQAAVDADARLERLRAVARAAKAFRKADEDVCPYEPGGADSSEVFFALDALQEGDL